MSISLMKECNKPTSSFLYQLEEWRFRGMALQCFSTPHFLHVFTEFFVCHPKDIVDGYNAKQYVYLSSVSRKCHPVVHFKHLCLHVPGRRLRLAKQCDRLRGRPFLSRCCENDVAQLYIVDQFPFLVNDINNVNGFDVAGDFLITFSTSSNGVVLIHINAIRGHQPANTVFRVTKRGKCYFLSSDRAV